METLNDKNENGQEINLEEPEDETKY